jgi:hypothetical protein
LLLWADQNMPFPDENRQALLDVIVEYGVYPLAAGSGGVFESLNN